MTRDYSETQEAIAESEVAIAVWTDSGDTKHELIVKGEQLVCEIAKSEGTGPNVRVTFIHCKNEREAQFMKARYGDRKH